MAVREKMEWLPVERFAHAVAEEEMAVAIALEQNVGQDHVGPETTVSSGNTRSPLRLMPR